MQAIERFRKNLRGLMEYNGVGQRELARLADTFAPNINRALNGKVHDFSICWAEKLAGAFGRQLCELLLDPVTFQKKFLPKKPNAA